MTVLSVCTLFSACSSADEIARHLDVGGDRGGWDRLNEFLHLLVDDVIYPYEDGDEPSFLQHGWLDTNSETGQQQLVSLRLEQAWAALQWLRNERELPSYLARHSGIDLPAEATRSRLLASDRSTSALVMDSIDTDSWEVLPGGFWTFRDPVCNTIAELTCAATFHSDEHFPSQAAFRDVGRWHGPFLLHLLAAGDRDPALFAPVPSRDPDNQLDDLSLDSPLQQYLSYMLATARTWGVPIGEEFAAEDEPPPKRVRSTADALAQREALIDPEVAARALHTPEGTHTLRNRSVPARPPPPSPAPARDLGP